MSIASKLQEIANCKQAIKEAIEAKGVTVGSVPLSSYDDKIMEIETGGEVIQYVYPLVKVDEEDWDSRAKEDNTLYAII